MSALNLVMTTAGLGRFTAAQAADDIDLTIAQVGVTNTVFDTAPTLTALPGEMKRIATIAGEAVGGNVVHMIVRDDGPDTYTIRGFGLFLADGTLFAVYGQPTPIVEKSASSTLLFALDIAFPAGNVDLLTFGDTNFLNPPATSTTKGVVELATLAEANAGDEMRVTTGAIVKAMIADALAAVGEALAGISRRTIYGSGLVKGGGDLTANRKLTVDAASGADVRAGAAGDMAVTPASLRVAGGIFVMQQSLVPNAGYRVWSDGLKECWGMVAVPANSAVAVVLPIAHTTFVAPAGAAGVIAQDEQMLGVENVTLAGFTVRSRNPLAATYYWHTKGV